MSSPVRQRPGTPRPTRRGAKAADEPQAQAEAEPKGLTDVELVDATLSAGPRRSARNQKAEPPSQPPPSSEGQQQQRAKGQDKQKQQQRHQQPVLETDEGPADFADEEMAGKEKEEAEDAAPAPGRRGGRAAGGRKRATAAAAGDAAQPPEAAAPPAGKRPLRRGGGAETAPSAAAGGGPGEGEGVSEEQRPQRQERPFDAFAAPGKEVLHREASDVGGGGVDGEGEGAEGAAEGGAGAAEAPRGGRKGAAAGRPPKRAATGKRPGGSAASAARVGPTRDMEVQLQAQGYVAVGGADEAGRGPLAGPVVAAVVVLPPPGDPSWRPPAGLNDSKAMSEEEREAVYEQLITDPRVKWAVSVVDHQEIDRVNILQAALGAMRQSAVKLLQQHQHQKSGAAAASIAAPPPPPPALDFLLVDGNRMPKDLPVPGRTVVKGDATVSCIAAASCIAKVTRDRLMLQLDEQYPQYGFAQHKGYGVPAHMEAIRRHGPSAVHRRSFEPVKSMTGWSREAMLRQLQEDEDEGEGARQQMAGQKAGQGQQPVAGASTEGEAARGVAKGAGDRRVPGARTRADGASGGKRPGTRGRGRGRGRAAEEEDENVSEEEGNEEQAEESGEEDEEDERPRRKAARVLQGSGDGVRGRGRAGSGLGSARTAQQGAGVAEAQPAGAQDTAAAPVSRGGRPRRKSAGKGA